MTGDGNGFTVKEIVVEIRDVVKDLSEKVDRIDRQGSIGTKAELEDHELRLRTLADRVQRIEDTQVTRADIHGLKSELTAIRMTLADRPEQLRQFREVQEDVESLKTWRARLVGMWMLTAALASAALTFVVSHYA